MTTGIGGHQLPVRGRSDDWLTPQGLITALGPFDLDPCASPLQLVGKPWVTAARMICLPDDGLAATWTGFAWVNPPYGPQTGVWMNKLADHGNGLGLIFARTETADFHSAVWQRADALWFLRGRLTFHTPDGRRGKANCGGPSVVVAYGPEAVGRLSALTTAGYPGHLVRLK